MNKFIKKAALFILSFFIGMGLARITKAQDSSLLFEVSGNGLMKPSYVYGTIHLACEDDLQFKNELRSYVDDTEIMVMEIDMDNPNMMAELQQAALDPQMRNMATDLSDEAKTEINKLIMPLMGAGIEQVGILRPFALYATLVQTLPQCEKTFSFEEKFLALAQSEELEVLGLETVTEQFTVIDEVPREAQIEWIEDIALDVEKVRGEFQALVNSYKKEDIEALHQLFMVNPQYADYANILLYKRNKNWIPKMKEMMQEQPAFFAVGAAHLGSENGVIALLRKQGYTVKPVKI